MTHRNDGRPSRQGPAARVSVTFPDDDYAGLKDTAAANRVSIAWVVRDAVHAYLQRRTARPPGRERESKKRTALRPQPVVTSQR